MSVLCSPPQAAEIIISRCFKSVFRIKSALVSLLKIYCLPVTAGETSCKTTAAGLGATPPGSETRSAQRWETPPGPLGCSPGLTSSEAALPAHSPHKNACLRSLLGFYPQPLGLVGVTPLSPTFFSLTSALGAYSATCHHLPSVGRKRNSEKNNLQLKPKTPMQMNSFNRGLVAPLFKDIQKTLQHILFVLSKCLAQRTKQIKYFLSKNN